MFSSWLPAILTAVSPLAACLLGMRQPSLHVVCTQASGHNTSVHIVLLAAARDRHDMS
jgi:hypothetical protein